MMDNGFDEDQVIVPTMESVLSGDIYFPFRDQHSSDNPTHKLEWVEDPEGRVFPYSHPVLKGLRALTPNTEITFDYNYRVLPCHTRELGAGGVVM